MIQIQIVKVYNFYNGIPCVHGQCYIDGLIQVSEEQNKFTINLNGSGESNPNSELYILCVVHNHVHCMQANLKCIRDYLTRVMILIVMDHIMSCVLKVVPILGTIYAGHLIKRMLRYVQGKEIIITVFVNPIKLCTSEGDTPPTTIREICWLPLSTQPEHQLDNSQSVLTKTTGEVSVSGHEHKLAAWTIPPHKPNGQYYYLTFNLQSENYAPKLTTQFSLSSIAIFIDDGDPQSND